MPYLAVMMILRHLQPSQVLLLPDLRIRKLPTDDAPSVLWLFLNHQGRLDNQLVSRVDSPRD